LRRSELVAALDSVRAWAKGLPESVEPFRLQPIPGLVVQVREGRGANAEKCRRYRERRSTRVDGLGDAGRDTPPTPVATPVEHSSLVVSQPPPSSPPLHSPSDSQPLPDLVAASAASLVSDPSQNLSGSKDLNRRERDWKAQPPRTLDDAREMPIQERAQHIQQRPDQAQWLQPEQWPEVRLAIAAYRSVIGKPRLAVGTYGSDSGVRRLVELYAAGLTPDEVCGGIPLVVASPWWSRDGVTRDLSSLSVAVLRRELDVPRVGATARGILEQLESSGRRGGEPQPIGAAVRRVAGEKQ
jgi:hypothetical protein